MKLAIALMLIAAVAAPALGQGHSHVWYINDGPDAIYWWEDTSIGSFWEWMYPTAVEAGDTLCGVADIPDGEWATAYYAVTYPHSITYSDCHFWAVLYLENSYGGPGETVYATLGVADAATMTFNPVAGPVGQVVTNTGTLTCGQAYTFDFGIPPDITLVNGSLALEISQVNLYDVLPHIFWDSECCPSALYAECPSPVGDETWGMIKALYR
jgi:hypothetical protein